MRTSTALLPGFFATSLILVKDANAQIPSISKHQRQRIFKAIDDNTASLPTSTKGKSRLLVDGTMENDDTQASQTLSNTVGMSRRTKGKAGKKQGSGCSDPLDAILTTLECIENGDVPCASAGYNGTAFVKLHNGIDTNTVIDEDFWQGALLLATIDIDVNYQMNNIAPNKASIRYVETVTTTDGSSLGLPPSSDYPFGQVFLQYEHALVTVDDGCRMIAWDQYGDNKEQADVDDASFAILCSVGLSEFCST